MAEDILFDLLNVPPLRFPEFKGEWEKEELGNSCNVLMCKRIFANQTNKKGGIPFYKIGTIGSIPDCYISPNLFCDYQKKYSYPKKGEVLVTCAGTIGRCFQYDGIDSYFQDSNIVWIDNPKKIVDNDFLFYLISAHDWNKLNTTTITRLYNDDIRKIILSFPKSKQEQTKITSLFSAVNKRLSVQRKIIEDTKTLKKALLQKVFPREGEPLPSIRFKGFTEPWEQRKLGDESEYIVAGGDIDKEKLLETGKYPVIANALTHDGVVGYYQNSFRVQGPALTITGRGDVGHAQARKSNFTPIVRLLAIKTKHDVDYLENAINKKSFVVESTGVPQLTVPKVQELELYFPKQFSEETKIGQLFSGLDSLITLHQRKADSIQQVKKFLLANMFC